MRGEIQTGQKSAQIECSGVVSGAEANVRSPGKNKIERTSHPGLIRRVHMPAIPWLGWALYIYICTTGVTSLKPGSSSKPERYAVNSR